MKIFDILLQGEENALPGSEIDKLLGITPRERRAEIKRFREREAARARAITEKVRAADAILKQCDGQTQLEPLSKI